MIKSAGLYRIIMGLTIVFVLLAMASFTPLNQAKRMVLGYFILTFGMFTSMLFAWAFALSGSKDEKGKGKKAMGGLIGHFAGSLAILLIYFFLFFRGSLFEVWTALFSYVISLIVFVVLISKMK